MTAIIDSKVNCHHCGEACGNSPIRFDDHDFCCQGCQTVYEILQTNGLCTYYDLNENAGVSLKAKSFGGKFDYLSQPEIEQQLLVYSGKNLNKVVLHIPAVHCSSCVWLLENFAKIRAGVLNARLNFIKKELAISYDPTKVGLKEIVALLATLGYEPQLNLASIASKDPLATTRHRLIYQIGVAGFCFGNIMLLSFPEYFRMNLDDLVDARYQRFFLYLNFLLSLPVFFYGASDYLKGAWQSLRDYFARHTDNISVDVPIALGITALFGRSLYETFVNHAAGYWDSLAGLVFFLLIGKWVQQLTFNYLAFERDYQSYFPLAVKMADRNTFKNVGELQVDDRILIHNQEVIPTDAVLLSGQAQIDYSFVTGESAPETVAVGERVFAGGRQVGQQLELRVEKSVSQSYLTQLWNDESFQKQKPTPASRLSQLFSKYFTLITLGIAGFTGVYWAFVDASMAWLSMTAVLMVACPCALTLSMPFAMNAVLGIFGKNKFYVKNQAVIQLFSEIDTIVFDKTGTLTRNQPSKISFVGDVLSPSDKRLVAAATSHSTHPLSRMIFQHLQTAAGLSLTNFTEEKGQGIRAEQDGNTLTLGNAAWVNAPASPDDATSVHIAINGHYRGYFRIETAFRANWEKVLNELKSRFRLGLLSGDHAATRAEFRPFFAEEAIRFNQNPDDKLAFIKAEQANHHRVMMVGDGLNDAGALRRSDVGIAVSEATHAFSPACDAILDAGQFHRLPEFLRFGKTAVGIVKASFLLSLVYNFICIGWAASGNLSPLFAAIFMPLSTISVVAFAVGLTHLFAYRRKLL